MQDVGLGACQGDGTDCSANVYLQLHLCNAESAFHKENGRTRKMGTNIELKENLQ